MSSLHKSLKQKVAHSGTIMIQPLWENTLSIDMTDVLDILETAEDKMSFAAKPFPKALLSGWSLVRLLVVCNQPTAFPDWHQVFFNKLWPSTNDVVSDNAERGVTHH